ncbi:MAG TPA: dTDP-4-dehydrorhamnose reductase [Gammaproteobacteria bacterium]|nr:dTDP-4-dehydrorhamnose reductase [Gammaproteobacteria bacterium]
MKVLVLGANGQLGLDLCKLYPPRHPAFELLPFTRNKLDVSDLIDIAPTLEANAFDVLVNCTGYHKTDEVETNATLAFTINTHAVRIMAETCHKKHAKLIHISTDYVFSGEAVQPYTESDCPRPINVYGASKAMGEMLALMTHDQVYIVRVASLFGSAGASGKGGNFVETMLRIAKEKGEVRVVNDIVMSPTATADIVDGIVTLIEKQSEPGIYHAVNSGQATWYEFAREIIKRAGIKAAVIPLTSSEFPTVARRPAYSVLDNSKLSSIVGEIPHWTDALDRYLHK